MSKDERKEVKLWLEPDDHLKLATLAKANKRSIRSEVYFCILRGIREQEDDDLARRNLHRPLPLGVEQYNLEAE